MRVIVATLPSGEVQVFSSLKKASEALNKNYGTLANHLTRKNTAYEKEGLKIQRVSVL
jgi:hypothetical protein